MICCDTYTVKPGKDLDDVMYKRVMHTITDFGNGRGIMWGDGNARYSTEIEWAMMVVKKLQGIYFPEDEDGTLLKIDICVSEGFSGYIVTLCGGEGWGTTIPHAICLAALDALSTYDSPGYTAVPLEQIEKG